MLFCGSTVSIWCQISKENLIVIFLNYCFLLSKYIVLSSTFFLVRTSMNSKSLKWWMHFWNVKARVTRATLTLIIKIKKIFRLTDILTNFVQYIKSYFKLFWNAIPIFWQKISFYQNVFLSQYWASKSLMWTTLSVTKSTSINKTFIFQELTHPKKASIVGCLNEKWLIRWNLWIANEID